MIVLRWSLASVLAAFFLLAAVGNAGTLVRYALLRKSGSMVPLIGGAAGTLAVLAAPLPALRAWACVPPLVDVGCAPCLLLVLIAWLGRVRRGSR